jgi:hypothetical protein
MPTKRIPRRKVPSVVAAVVRPVKSHLSRIEDLLIEVRGVQDLHVKRIASLQVQLDELTSVVKLGLAQQGT